MEMSNSLNPEDLLNDAIPFDQNKVALLDEIVSALYSQNPTYMAQANEILTKFQQNENAWQFVDIILENSNSNNAKFIALSVLDNTVSNKWKILPEDQKSGIKEYITNLVISLGKSEVSNTTGGPLLTKLNQTLVSIVKHEWTTTWKDFISEICEASKTDQGLCENTMNILKLLSEEIFDFSKNQISSKKANELKETMTVQFASIYDLCVFVLNTSIENSGSVKKDLVKSCLKTFASFMSWIPFGYIFETDILEKLINNFYVVPSFRNDTLPCLVEVASLKISPDDPKCDEYTEKQFLLFITFVSKTVEVTKDRNLTEEYSRISEGQRPYFEIFCLQTGLFLSEFINNQIEKIEQLTSFNEVPSEFSENLAGAVGKGLDYLIQLSNIELSELFKTMMEFWHKFTYYILVATKGRDMFSKTGDTTLINLQNNKLVVNPTLRQDIIPNYLEKLCITMIRTMAKPEEVLVVIDENGNPVEELITDTETVSLYDTMRENLVFLTNIDSKKVYTIITSSLDNLLANEANFSFDALNKICWALGSISECMMEEEENKFVVTVIKELLNLVDKKKGKDNKALVAADIMYVVGQFPRFLCTHWAFLKTVIKKLNEFMAEKHPGVQDMATEVFLKISKKTKRMFVIKQGNEEPYICELIRNLPENTKDLEVKQSLHIYEGLGHMISEEKDEGSRSILLEQLMQYTQNEWQYVLDTANNDPSSLQSIDTIRTIGFIIKANERVAFALGSSYVTHLAKIFQELMQVYKLYSENISSAISNGPGSYNNSILRATKTVRREILNLIATFIKSNEDPELIVTEFLPILSELITDYNQNVPNARDPEVLSLFSTLIEKMGDKMSEYIPDILNYLFESTLTMINNDYTTFMDFRKNFFGLIKNIVNYSLEGLFGATEENFKVCIDSIIWAIKHYQIQLAEIGLDTMSELLTKVVSNQEIANVFFQNFYMSIMQDTFFVLTDSLHKSGFYKQALIIMRLISVVENDIFEGTLSEEVSNNKEFVIEYLSDALVKLFPNTNKVQIQTFVLNMFNNCNEKKEFVSTMRDFLIALKEFAGNDQDSLYELEKQAAMKEAQEREELRKNAIPGLVKQKVLENFNGVAKIDDEGEDDNEL